MPYVFADIAYSISNELLRPNWELYLPYNFDYAYPYYYQELAKLRSVAWSITPGLGLRINIKKNLFMNFETAAEFFCQKDDVNYQFNFQFYNYTTNGINAKPFKCSLGLLF